MVDFASIANIPLEDLPEPVKLPIGHYIWSVDRLPEQAPSKKGDGLNIPFRLKCVGPIEPFDGDPDELEAFGNPAGSIRTLNFYIPEVPREDEEEGNFNNRKASAIKQLVNFLTQHLQVEGSSIAELLSGCLHHQCVADIKHTPGWPDKTVLREEIGKTAPVVND